MGLFEFKIRQFSKIMKWAEMQDVSQLRQFLFDDVCKLLMIWKCLRKYLV